MLPTGGLFRIRNSLKRVIKFLTSEHQLVEYKIVLLLQNFVRCLGFCGFSVCSACVLGFPCGRSAASPFTRDPTPNPDSQQRPPTRAGPRHTVGSRFGKIPTGIEPICVHIANPIYTLVLQSRCYCTSISCPCVRSSIQASKACFLTIFLWFIYPHHVIFSKFFKF